MMTNIDKFVLTKSEFDAHQALVAGNDFDGHDTYSLDSFVKSERDEMFEHQPNLMDVGYLLGQNQRAEATALLLTRLDKIDPNQRDAVLESIGQITEFVWRGFAIGNIVVRNHWPHELADELLYPDIPDDAPMAYQHAEGDKISDQVELLEARNLETLLSRLAANPQETSSLLPENIIENPYLQRCQSLGALVAYNLAGKARFDAWNNTQARLRQRLLKKHAYSAIPSISTHEIFSLHYYLRARGYLRTDRYPIQDPEEEYDFSLVD